MAGGSFTASHFKRRKFSSRRNFAAQAASLRTSFVLVTSIFMQNVFSAVGHVWACSFEVIKPELSSPRTSWQRAGWNFCSWSRKFFIGKFSTCLRKTHHVLLG